MTALASNLDKFNNYQKISDRFYEGERPLYAEENKYLHRVKFYPGESALKHTDNIMVKQCEFMGKYPFWHSNQIVIEQSIFTIYARAAIWYTDNLTMNNCVVEAPKMFRRVTNLQIENTRFPNAGETLWNCDNVTIRNVEMRGADYVFMNCENVDINGFKLQGNYSFQDAKNVTIRNAYLDSKDAFWGTENVTVYDSVLDGEYLGWHSKNLRLVNCTIRGEQPLCYATDLIMENCVMEETDLCFEYSSLEAEIVSDIISVKNPLSGLIKAHSIGDIILDKNNKNPGGCIIKVGVEAGV